MPDWVPVWFWLRFLRAEPVSTPLPQQGINPEAMSMDEYVQLEQEWARSGSPTATAKQIVRAITADPLSEEIPF